VKDNIFASLLHHEARSTISCASRCAGAMLRQHKQEKKSLIKIHVEWMQVGLSRGKNKETFLANTPTTNCTWSDLEIHPNVRGEKPTSNHLSYGTEWICMVNISVVYRYVEHCTTRFFLEENLKVRKGEVFLLLNLWSTNLWWCMGECGKAPLFLA
jgi:hypothetical protein